MLDKRVDIQNASTVIQDSQQIANRHDEEALQSSNAWLDGSTAGYIR